MFEVKKEYAMIIGGQSVKGDGDSFAVLNPATEQPVTYCPQASIKQHIDELASVICDVSNCKNRSL